MPEREVTKQGTSSEGFKRKLFTLGTLRASYSAFGVASAAHPSTEVNSRPGGQEDTMIPKPFTYSSFLEKDAHVYISFFAILGVSIALRFSNTNLTVIAGGLLGSTVGIFLYWLRHPRRSA